ncbi:uncharacterized protein [Oscarella lobularis]|uniref:uncharacterized protein isoform X2 n=1 Tax=Oscarella lobularis TaxID=121494 RepID=UPI0033139F43
MSGSSASEKSSKKGEKGKKSAHVSAQEQTAQSLREESSGFSGSSKNRPASKSRLSAVFQPVKAMLHYGIQIVDWIYTPRSNILITIILTVLIMFAINFDSNKEVMQEIVNRGFGKFPERDQPSFVLDRKEEKDRFREALTNKKLYGIYSYILVTGPKGCGKTSLVQDVAREILESDEGGLFYFNYGEDTVSYEEAILREFDEMIAKARSKRIMSWLVKDVGARKPSERGFTLFMRHFCDHAVTYAKKWNRGVVFILDNVTSILHQEDGVKKLKVLQRRAKNLIDNVCPIRMVFVDSDGLVKRVFSSQRSRLVIYEVNDVSREEAAQLLESQNIGVKSLNTTALYHTVTGGRLELLWSVVSCLQESNDEGRSPMNIAFECVREKESFGGCNVSRNFVTAVFGTILNEGGMGKGDVPSHFVDEMECLLARNILYDWRYGYLQFHSTIARTQGAKELAAATALLPEA